MLYDYFYLKRILTDILSEIGFESSFGSFLDEDAEEQEYCSFVKKYQEGPEIKRIADVVLENERMVFEDIQLDVDFHHKYRFSIHLQRKVRDNGGILSIMIDGISRYSSFEEIKEILNKDIRNMNLKKILS